MNYPQMGRNRKYTLNIPDFSGGINASKPMQDIQDNQAAMIKNMWLKDGVLQTRPAMRHGGNAYFLSIFDLKDLGVEIKLGYETYNADDTAQGDAQQRIYRLFYSGIKEFLLFDVENKSFTNVELDFQKSLYGTCFNEGEFEYEFFYSNGLSSLQLSLDSGYIQAFWSEVYGFIKISRCTSLEGKAIVLQFYLKPYVENGEVKLKMQVFNSVKDLPAEHVPYCPTVAIDYGESYSQDLDDFNLMSGSFMIDYNINKSTTQFPAEDIGSAYYKAHKGFGGCSGDGCACAGVVYGNRNQYDIIKVEIPLTNMGCISEVAIYGEFSFYAFLKKSWRKSEIYTDYDWGNVTEGDYIDESIATMKATVMKIKRSGDSFDICYYDSEGRERNPEDAAKWANSSENYVPCFSIRGEAELEDSVLKIRLPAAETEIKYPYAYSVYHQGTDQGNGLTSPGHTTYHVSYISSLEPIKTADIYIEQIKVVMNTREGGDVEYWDKQNQSELITKNTLSTWYGGTNSGYTGGTRLFVAGHPEFKNVIRWSGVNDSSYFLENNFSYVGRDDEAITALNKQDGYLVVFKEHELYALEYTYTTDEKNGTIVYFPIKPISPYIGCDCPGTIQFISNRLTWLTSDGKVYTLFSENSYSERNVREVSKHIENELKKHTREKLQASKSVDYNGNYLIFVGKSVYLWNYDINPYYNYTSSEKAQKSLCWFKWELPHEVEYIYTVNGELVIICKSDDGAEYRGYVLNYDEDTDTLIDGSDESITTFYKSKLWDFGNPFKFKRISRAFFEIEAASGEIEVRYFTENGTDEIKSLLDARYSGNRAYNTRPHLVRVRSAGFELESKAAVKLYSAAIFAETYGEVK